MQYASNVFRSLLLGGLFFSAACGDLERVAPYDPESSLENQAKASVSGSVELVGETDYQGVTVELQNAHHTYSVESRPDGVFEIAGVVPGTYALYAHTRYFGQHADQIEISLGETVSLPTLSLTPLENDVSGSALSKKLEDGEEDVAGGVFLRLSKSASIRGAGEAAPRQGFRSAAEVTGSVNFTVVSEPDGTYTFTGVPAGVYLLIATGDDGATEEVSGIEVTGEGSVTVEDVLLEPLTGILDIVGTAEGVDNEIRTSSRTVTLRTIAVGAQEMQLGLSPTHTAAGCNYTESRAYAAEVTDFSLGVTDGTQTVCVRYEAADGRKTSSILDSIVLDTTGPTGGSVEVSGSDRNGTRYVTATNGSIDVKLAANDALGRVVGLKIANAAGSCSAALAAVPEEGFTTLKSWILATPGANQEGDRTVCAAFKDEAGNWSDPVSHTIRYDTRAPSGGAISIADGDAWATSTQIELTLSAVGASEMMLANGGSFGAAQWEPFRSRTMWILENTQGTRTVRVKFRDEAGNESGTYSDTITLDTIAPSSPSVLVNSGDTWATSENVSLTLDAVGATGMRISTDGVFDDEPLVAYSTSAGAALPGTDGTKFVYVRFEDDAGNLSPIVSDFVELDRVAPSAGMISIDNGAIYTRDTTVDLSLPANGASQVYLSETGCLTGGAWQDYVALDTYTLTSSPGLHTVYAVYRDEAGNVSNCRNDSILLDESLDAPSLDASLRGIEGISNRTRKVRVSLDVTGLTADVDAMIVSNESSFAGAGWTPVVATLTHYLTEGDGTKTVYVKVRDKAGNESSVLQPQIELDQTGPETPVLSLNDVTGDGFALGSTTVELRWTTPSAGDLAGFRIERYVEGYETNFSLLAQPGSGVSTLVDDATATSGYTHHYRIRAYDDLGNVSSNSTVVSARPFLPMSSLRMLRGDGESRYFLSPSAGTFLVSTDWEYDNPFPGDTFRDQLGFNVLQFSRDDGFNGFNDEFIIRTSNVDNTLVYESRFNPRHDMRGFGDSIFGGGSSASIGVNASGQVQIVYSNTGIFYASNESGQWTSDAHYPTISVGSPTAGFNSQGDVMYTFNYAAAFGQAQIKTRLNGVWTNESSGDSDIFNPSYVDVVMDDAGNGYLVYAGGLDASSGYSSQMGARIIRRSSDGIWSSPVEFDATETARYVSAARGPFGTCLSYWRATSADLRYACLNDSGGTSGPNTVVSGNGKASAIAVDPLGFFWVAYVDAADDVYVWSSLAQQSWLLHTNATQPAIAIGPDGTAHVVFRTLSNPDLMYFNNAAYGWSGRTLVSEGNQGYDPDIVVGNDNRVHITYRDGLNGQLGYINLDSPAGRHLGVPAEAVDAVRSDDGRYHVAFRYPGNDRLLYGLMDGYDLLALDYVDPDISTGHNLDLELDDAGNVHIVYVNQADSAVRYATNASGSWASEQMLAVSPNFPPRLAMHGGEAHVLVGGQYVHGTSGSWSSETVSGQPGGMGDIAVAPDGTVHLVSYPAFLIDIGDLVYKYGVPGAWNEGFVETGWYGRPRVRVGPDGKTYIAVELAGDLVLFSGTGSTYDRQVVASTNQVGGGVDFVFDSEGFMHFVFGDQTDGTIRYATNQITGAFQSISLAPSSLTGENAIFLDGQDNPSIVTGNGDVVILEGFSTTLNAESVERTTAY